MTEQLKAQVVEQRAHEIEQHTEMIRLLVERETQARAEKVELEAKLEAKLEAQRKESEAQREAYETKFETTLETKLEAQRQAYETKFEAHRRETQGQARTNKVTALQLRFEALGEAKLLEDDELSAIEDKVADAIGAAATEDGTDGAWECVMQMVRLSEGIASDKTFARQLRRKFV